MTPSIQLKPGDRNALLRLYRRSPDPRVRPRAHVLLLLADGHTWETTAAVLYTSSSTIARWQRRFWAGGLAAVCGRGSDRPPRAGPWAAVAVAWVLCLPPAAFGLARSRWCCEAVAVVLWEERGVPVSRETVRRWLRTAGLVWRRPRPVLRPRDPERERKLGELRRLLHALPADQTAVFMDEVELHTNPKVGCMWMRRGRQAAVEAPPPCLYRAPTRPPSRPSPRSRAGEQRDKASGPARAPPGGLAQISAAPPTRTPHPAATG